MNTSIATQSFMLSPYSKNVETNGANASFQQSSSSSPSSTSQNFRSNTLNLSYSCMNNIKRVISTHNTTQLDNSKNRNNEEKSATVEKQYLPYESKLQ